MAHMHASGSSFVSSFITAAKQVMFLSLFVYLSVCLLPTLRKNFQTDLHEIFREGWQWVMLNKRLNFGGDPDHGSVSGYGSVS